jgi:hypothetical protein
MQLLKTLLILTLVLHLIPLEAQSFRQQKGFFPKGIKKMKVYLGASEAQLLKRCPDCQEMGQGESFRRVYQTTLNDPNFQSVVFYVSTSKKEVYEMILLSKDGQEVKELTNELMGYPNAKDGEWRFSSKKTKQAFSIAAWTYQNKLIIAGAMEGSEWENGWD